MLNRTAAGKSYQDRSDDSFSHRNLSRIRNQAPQMLSIRFHLKTGQPLQLNRGPQAPDRRVDSFRQLPQAIHFPNIHRENPGGGQRRPLTSGAPMGNDLSAQGRANRLAGSPGQNQPKP